MRGFLVFLICCLTAVALVLGAAYLNLLPDETYSLVGIANPSGNRPEVVGEGTLEIGEDEARELPSIETAQQLSKLMAEAIEAFEPEVAVQVTGDIGPGEREAYLLGLAEEAYITLRREYPEIFWMSMGQYAIQWSNTSSGRVPLTVQLNYCYSPEKTAVLQEEIDLVVAQVMADAPTGPYEAVKYFHDWIVDNTTYDSPVADSQGMEGYEYAYNIDGVLLSGYAVCESYAKTFQLLCNLYGIPSQIVFGTSDGENHAWNYVQLDGEWYLVDCTADDPVSDREILRWDYFLKGWEGMVDDGRTISQIYIEDEGTYVSLSGRDYQGGTHIQEQQAQRAAIEEEVGRVEMRLNQVLNEGSAAVQPGGTVGTVSAVGTASHYTYELSGQGNDDAFFLLDPASGQLTVAGRPLAAGNYQIKVRVSGDNATAVAVIDFAVEQAGTTQPPADPDQGELLTDNSAVA